MRRRRGDGLEIACSWANSARAEKLAQRMVAGGCDGFVSFGLAGGLDPELRCGDLILPNRVAFGPSAWPVDAQWRERLSARLSPKVNVRGGVLVGSSMLVATPVMKAKLREEAGSVAVDMESHAVAAVAAKAGLPFVVIRVIADTCDKAVPAWAAEVIDATGKVKPVAMMMALAAHPGDLLKLPGLANENRRAMAALRRVASLAGRDFASS